MVCNVSKRRGFILFDGNCGICKKVVIKMEGVVKKRGFEFAPLQSPWVSEQLDLKSDEDLLHDLRLLLPDGRHLAGADAYRYVMRHIWWAYPIYLLSLVPGLNLIFDWAYRKFADNRHLISSTCSLAEHQSHSQGPKQD